MGEEEDVEDSDGELGADSDNEELESSLLLPESESEYPESSFESEFFLLSPVLGATEDFGA